MQNPKENNSKKRTKIEVIADIIKILQEKKGKIKPTHLMYKANLSHKTLKTYVNELESRGLIKISKIKDKWKDPTKKNLIEITEKGNSFYNEYSKMKEFEKTFGL